MRPGETGEDAGNESTRIVIEEAGSATGAQIQRIISKCRECRVAFRTLPALSDVINGTVSLQQIREVKVDDLLGRAPVKLDHLKIQAKLNDKVVMVTGAGGSIGSELVRQVAGFSPKKLILFERSESDLHRMELELAGYGEQVDFVPVVGDILDVARLKQVMGDFRPDSIFHAAAYKHVPMMERNCFQAVNNNIFGTYNVALIARQNGVEDFVMISTDKAVNPTNIMGATKRVAELLILGLQNHSTRYVSVRFGNVLGSTGSVLPRFQEQIAKRQPVTVTHPDMKRYFMTIPEAVELVLEASSLGKGGEIFVLDMGEPVKIADLARNLIQLSGLEPDVDVPIVYTGLRPSEKLFEDSLFGLRLRPPGLWGIGGFGLWSAVRHGGSPLARGNGTRITRIRQIDTESNPCKSVPSAFSVFHPGHSISPRSRLSRQ